MLEKKNEQLKVTRIEFAIDAVKGMRYRVRDLRSLQVPLQLKNIIAYHIDLAMLVLRNSPNKNMQLARIVWKKRGDLFADKSARPINDLQAAFDRIVVGKGDVVHPPFE